MSARFNKEYFIAAFWRAFRTFFQVIASSIVVGAAMNEIDWMKILSVALVAAIASLAMSFSKEIPEMATDGEMLIDDTDTAKDLYSLNLGDELDKLGSKKKVSFKVVHK